MTTKNTDIVADLPGDITTVPQDMLEQAQQLGLLVSRQAGLGVLVVFTDTNNLHSPMPLLSGGTPLPEQLPLAFWQVLTACAQKGVTVDLKGIDLIPGDECDCAVCRAERVMN